MPVTETDKICVTCKQGKPLNEYHPAKANKSGFMGICKKCHAAYSKNRYELNREKRLAYAAEYRKKNQAETRAASSDWRKKNPIRKKELDHRRRAKKVEAGVFVISRKESQRLYSSPCFYCGDTEKITLDHVVPISRGGTHSIGNIVPACSPCNTKKNAKTIMEWRLSKSTRRPQRFSS